MVGKDRNSVLRQLSGMSWDIGVFKIANEAMRLSDKDSEQNIKQNGLVWDMFTNCFLKLNCWL